MKKRGQITLFVIMAILIVGVIVVVFMFKDKLFKMDSSVVSPELNPVALEVERCFNKSLGEAARIAGMQGGYIMLPGDSLKTELFNIPYGSLNGINTLPKKNRIEKEISSYVELFVPACFNDELFKEYDILFGKSESQVSILNKKVEGSLKMPFYLRKEEKSVSLDKGYKLSINIPLGEFINFANSMIDNELNNKGYTYVSFFIDSDYNVAILPYSDKISVYSISRELENGGETYTFMFAKKQ